ncbi:ketopantoate reductase [Longilinea arvoryzae]|uniref:2-dehydropantoate 2-reductase n=1 Tax=Longilinea arvoryzae TaxID=360412 RepID=A0A0S7BGB5_9CHLR|nr:2-dehydropantoate 2-reductase [Longilinea arvoryzae]GAP13058.1 ketopantoate reductase [Longilinea arvoryzae]
MRIAVYGTGAVGGYYGGRLAQAGHDVTFIARGENLRALQTNGLRIDSTLGDFHLNPVKAVSDPAEIGGVDVVIPGVKTWQLPPILPGMAKLVGPETIIVTVQNGVDSHLVIGEALGHEHVIAGITRLFSTLVEPGHIVHGGGAAQFLIGELDGSLTPRVQRFYETLKATHGITAELTTDIQTELWAKLVMITSFGGVGSVTRAPIGVLLSVPQTRALLEGSIREIAAVAASQGHPLAADVLEKSLAFFKGQPYLGTSSLQRDVMAGKRSELDSLIGTVVRLAHEKNVPAPVNETIYAALLPTELKARGELEFTI